jgi:hypothetical protein
VKRLASAIEGLEENTTSAVRAARSCPVSLAPAAMMTGWPCGDRAMFSAPSTLKKAPS